METLSLKRTPENNDSNTENNPNTRLLIITSTHTVTQNATNTLNTEQVHTRTRRGLTCHQCRASKLWMKLQKQDPRQRQNKITTSISPLLFSKLQNSNSAGIHVEVRTWQHERVCASIPDNVIPIIPEPLTVTLKLSLNLQTRQNILPTLLYKCPHFSN